MNLAQCNRCGNLAPAYSLVVIEEGGNSRHPLCGDCLTGFQAWLANPAGGRLSLEAINAVARSQQVAELFGPGSPLAKYGSTPTPGTNPVPAFDRQA